MLSPKPSFFPRYRCGWTSRPTQGPAGARDAERAGARRLMAALLAHSILFTSATENISSAPVTRTAPNVKSRVICLPFNNPWNPLIRIPLSLRNNTYLHACVLSHFSRVRLFETLWFLYPWDSPGQNTGVGCHAHLRRSSPPRDPTHVSSVSCIGRRALCHFLYH